MRSCDDLAFITSRGKRRHDGTGPGGGPGGSMRRDPGLNAGFASTVAGHDRSAQDNIILPDELLSIMGKRVRGKFRRRAGTEKFMGDCRHDCTDAFGHSLSLPGLT